MFASYKAYCALFALLLLLVLAPIAADASPRILDDKAWREDIHEMVLAVKDNHPKPFHNVSEEEFNSATDTLLSRLGDLSDKEIIVEMAKIIALIEDGHTRLSFPRQHNELAFSFSHSKPKEPAHNELNFTSLPFRFRVLEGKLYIVEAAENFSHLIGAEILEIGQTPTSDALKQLSRVNYNDNDATDILLAGDRASLPEVLAALAITPSGAKTVLTLRPYQGEESIKIEVLPLAREPVLMQAPDASRAPLWLRDTTQAKWAQTLNNQNTHYIQLNQIEGGAPEIWLADFMREEIKTATTARAEKIIIDLRHNHGGSNDFNRSVINALTASKYNHYGKLIILIGRETFSAASGLLNEFEQYTDALFFGEPSGGGPDSYGDPKRLQLKNSGLDLRVSRLHWSSWIAFDKRKATAPHFAVAYTIDDYMNGRDPVLDAAMAYQRPENFAALVSDISVQEINLPTVEILFSRYATDPRIQTRNFTALAHDFIAEAGTLEKNTQTQAAFFLFSIANELDDKSAEAYLGIARTAHALGQKEDAKAALNAGLEVLPGNRKLRNALAALDK